MKWEDFKKERELILQRNNPFDRLETTNIECPKCGTLIYRDVGFVLATFPSKYNYKCLECGWKGVSY